MGQGMTYLASPYNHADPAVREMRFVQAVRETAAMMRQGLLVYSPIAYSHQFAADLEFDARWEYWKQLDFRMIDACDEVVVLKLPGWVQSIGVAAEVDYAASKGKRVSYRVPTES